jgi:hypothetical protein
MCSAIVSRVGFEVWQSQELEMNKVEAPKACDSMLLPNGETNILTILQMVSVILLSIQETRIQSSIYKRPARWIM